VGSFGYGERQRLTCFFQTGLCVYEVDDPSQRVDAQDESSRLLKRVAELEGVIREVDTAKICSLRILIDLNYKA